MPTIPVISLLQGVPEALTGRPFGFQPGCSNAPTSWRSSPLAAGLSLNTSTGLVSGTPTTGGVYVFTLWASNADGESAGQEFCVGVEAAAVTIGTDVDLDWDVLTGAVTPTRGIPPDGAQAFDPMAPVTRLRLGNGRILSVRLVKNGTTLDVGTPSVAKVGMKADDGDAVIQESTAFFKTGTGDTARIRIYLPLVDAGALKGAVEDGAKDADGRTVRAALPALCDIKLVYPNADTADIGPANLELNSDTFVVDVSRRIEA